jgi:hypothetical protein
VVVAIAMLLPLTLLNVAGESVTPWGFLGAAEYVHGWPYVCLHRTVEYGLSKPPERPRWGIPWLAFHSWQLWNADKRSLWSARLCWNLVVAAGLVLGIATIWEWRRRRRHRFFQFSISDLLLTLTLVAAILGWLSYMSFEFRREAAQIEALWGVDELEPFDVSEDYIGPRWLLLLIGEGHVPQLFYRTDFVTLKDLSAEGLKEALPHLQSLKYLRTVEILALRGNAPTKFSMLAPLRALRYLVIWGPISGADVQELTPLSRLREIFLWDWEDLDRQVVQQLGRALPHVKLTNPEQCEFGLFPYERYGW